VPATTDDRVVGDDRRACRCVGLVEAPGVRDAGAGEAQPDEPRRVVVAPALEDVDHASATAAARAADDGLPGVRPTVGHRAVEHDGLDGAGELVLAWPALAVVGGVGRGGRQHEQREEDDDGVTAAH
jgi:hypothetical protein